MAHLNGTEETFFKFWFVVIHRWVNLSQRVPPVALSLSTVRFAGEPNKNLLPEPIVVAQVLNTPSVVENREIVYMTMTNELRIISNGCVGARKVSLYFDPPLLKDVDYEDVTPYPLEKDEIVLHLRNGRKWRERAGLLKIVAINTGAGAVKVNGEDGVIVADVQPNVDLNSVYVESTARQQLIYTDESTLHIEGRGFNPTNNTLLWANGLVGNGVNYTITSSTDSHLVLRLAPGSHWCNVVYKDSLPVVLTLVAVNAGKGFVKLDSSSNNAVGRGIATIFQRPKIYSDSTPLYRVLSKKLTIRGEGFPLSTTPFKPRLQFSPPLIEGTDYTLRVLFTDELEVTLMDGRVWRESPGPLIVTAINTRGDEDGWLQLSNGVVIVANVLEGLVIDNTHDRVDVFATGEVVYQSALRQSIHVSGVGFKQGMSFLFNPPLRAEVDFEMDVKSSNRIDLHLRDGKKWRESPGAIVAKSVIIDGKEHQLGGTVGVEVAKVLSDPGIHSTQRTYYQSESKYVVVTGSGFTNKETMKVTLRPTTPGIYSVFEVSANYTRLKILPGLPWYSGNLSYHDGPSSSSSSSSSNSSSSSGITPLIPLEVVAVDTGAGNIVFDKPITIGYITENLPKHYKDDDDDYWNFDNSTFLSEYLCYA